MRFSTSTQIFSALLVASVWACSSEPGEGSDSNAGSSAGGTAAGGTASGGGGSGGIAAGGTSTAGSSSGGASGGSAPIAGNGGTAPGGAGGAGGASGGAGGTVAAGGAGCDNMPGVQGHPDCTFTYPEVPGFTLALVEEFNAPIDVVNDPIWTYSDGHPDGPVRFVKEGISFADGKMMLSMTDTPVEPSHSFAEEEDVGNRAYSSGELRTKYNNYRYGRYEVNYKSPSVKPGDINTNGGFVATMFVFRTPKFTQWREIDLEQTGDNSAAMATNLINGDNKPGWDASFADAASTGISFNARADFHTYAFEWTSESVTWYADGVMIRQQVGAAKLPIPEMSTKIMMNLWWGSFGGDGANNEYPLVTEYDWFRFYKWDMETTYPMDPAMLPQTDLDGAKNNAEDGITYIPPNQGN